MRDPLAAQRSRKLLRKEIRRARRALPEEQRLAAERALCRRIQALGAFKRARTVAVYFAFDGEPSLQRVAEAAKRQGKQVFAPVLLPRGMVFAPVGTAARRLDRNFFGIEEPPVERLIDPRRLDLVLTPLVAFDLRGARLGMGRGYYDRAFHFLRHRSHWSRPKLVGVGYSFQQVEELGFEPWDVPLWGAVTESRTYRFAGTRE